MSEQLYKQFVSDLGQVLEIPDLSPDEDNYCCLGFDDKIVLHLQYNKENEVLMLFTQLGTIEKDQVETLYPKLLKANLFWQGTGGAKIGVDDETKEVLMAYQIPIGFMDTQKFQDLIEGFINTAELWINTLDVVQHDMNIPSNRTPSPDEEDTSGKGIKA